MANVNETWFKTDEAKIFKFIKNPQITFLQKERPKERKINDIWFKPMDDVNLQVGEFYLCEKVLKNEAWINPSLPENLEPAFNQEEAPQNATLGDIWKKGMNILFILKPQVAILGLALKTQANIHLLMKAKKNQVRQNLAKFGKKEMSI